MRKKAGHRSHVSGSKRRHKGHEQKLERNISKLKKLFKGVRVL